jgi:hypothetical protein
MIRYPITLAELEALVDAESPSWRAKAAARSAGFVSAGKYEEASPIWSEVKSVFMKLQHNKCAYCERSLASVDHGGAIEHDLEHFRPKSSVEAWPGADRFKFATGTANATGYFWLAYHLQNYAAACKKCNSPLKKNYFPVPASRGAAPVDPPGLHLNEKPFLIHVIGEFDDDPREIIRFLGITAYPAKKTGPRRRRGDVTIAFFELNNREELRRERAELIDSLGIHLETIEDTSVPEARKTTAKKTVERMLRPSGRHSSCVQSMVDLYIENRTQAEKLILEARSFLDSLA